MRAVNLLPSQGADSGRRRPSAAVLVAATTPALAAGLVYLGWSVEHAHVKDARAELAAVQAHRDRVRPAAPDPGGAALATDRTRRETALRGILDERVAWDVVLDQVARVMPDDAWLTSLSLQSPTPAGVVSTKTSAPASSAPTGVSITGAARSQSAVGHLLARLALVPSLTNVTLSSTTGSVSGTLSVVQFQIGAAMRSVGSS